MPGKAQNIKQANDAARSGPVARRKAAEPAARQRQADPAAFQRLAASPEQASAADVLALQQTVGNRAVNGLLEQGALGVQRRATDPAAGGDIDPAISNEIQRVRGGGQPLDSGVAAEMGQAFGADFGGVRVHTGARADVLNRSLSARAFTIGSDIFLREGAYAPGTSDGKELLAHELTHVVQQGGNAASVQGKLTLGPAGDSYEQEADLLARQAMSGPVTRGAAAAPPGSARRQTIQRLGKKKTEPKPMADVIAEQLANEFKGFAGIKGFFTGTRKAQVAQKAQGGTLTIAQERNIDTLASIDPDRLTKMGFLLPADAEAKAHQYLFSPEEVAKLPVKQQMQILTYQNRFEIGKPEPATEEDKLKLEKATKPPEQRTPPPVPSREGRNPPPQIEPEPEKTPPPVPSREGRNPPPQIQPEQTTTQQPESPKSKTPSSSDIVLKPGDDGKETASHNIESYRDIVAGYVKKAGTDHGMISQTSGILMQDYIDVKQGADSYHGLGEKLKITDEKIKSENSTTPDKEKSANKKEREGIVSAQTSLLKSLHEPDFDQATKDAHGRAENAESAVMAATQEKATIEYLYDEVEKKKADVKKRRSSATKEQKKDASFNLITAQQEKAAADEARGMVQQAKMSMDVIGVRRLSTDTSKTYVQKTLDRLPGTVRKLLGKIVTGVLGAIVGFATLGIVSLKGNTGVKGYMGQGLEKKGFPFKPTFLNDIANQIQQFKTTVKARFGGPKAVDVLSAILRGFNEIIIQNIINVAGKIATITGLLATVLSLLAGVTMGATAPVAAIVATISSIATFVALIAAAVKAAVAAVRLTLDGLVALLNQDAKMSNVLTSRAKQSGMETMSDVTQLVGSALGPATGNVIKGREFTNMFDPTAVINMNVTGLTASSTLGQTIGGTVTSTGMTTVAPLVMGPIAQGIKGATDENYGLYTAGPDDLGGKDNYLKSKSQATKQGNAQAPKDLPQWMQTELEKQNKLRDAAFKGRTATAVGQITGVTSQSTQLANKLGQGKSESDKMHDQVVESKSKGNDQVDSEHLEMSKAQSGLMGVASNTITDTVESITHGKQELQKLAEERK